MFIPKSFEGKNIKFEIINFSINLNDLFWFLGNRDILIVFYQNDCETNVFYSIYFRKTSENVWILLVKRSNGGLRDLENLSTLISFCCIKINQANLYQNN